MSDATVALDCSCGNSVSARLTDAGSSLSCRACGNLIRVPGLGQLRQMLGREAHITNPVEAINKQLNLGKSPAGNNCLTCQTPNAEEYHFTAVCESQVTRGKSDPTAITHFVRLFGWFIFGWISIIMLYFLRQDEPLENEVVGRDVSVDVTLPVCQVCSMQYKPKKPKSAKKLMKQVPLYSELLDEYPDLKLQPL